VTGGGLADPSDTARYKIIDSSTPNPAQTLQSYLQSPDPLIIELRADVELGALNNQNRRPLINPELIASNLGVIRVASNKTLFSDDAGRLNVTYHHDAFTLVRQRTPRMRFGNAHVYNILVDDTLSAPFPGTQTAVNSTINAAVLVENSDFLEVKTPLAFSGGGVNVSYTLKEAATGNVVMTYSVTQAAAPFTQFDTAAFFLSKNANSANYNFIIKAVDVSLAGGN
jgi:hypothetical protein